MTNAPTAASITGTISGITGTLTSTSYAVTITNGSVAVTGLTVATDGTITIPAPDATGLRGATQAGRRSGGAARRGGGGRLRGRLLSGGDGVVLQHAVEVGLPYHDLARDEGGTESMREGALEAISLHDVDV